MDKLDRRIFYILTKVTVYIVCWLNTLLCLIFVQPQKMGAKKSMGGPRASKCVKLITKTL